MSKLEISEMNKKPTMIDLCSGLGGASEWMYRRGWNIYRFDNDSRFAEIPNTQIIDIRELTVDDLPSKPDFIWANPPCECFSVASIGHHWKNGTPSNAALEAIALIEFIKDLIESAKPRYSGIENPMGMMRKTTSLGLPDYHFPMAVFGSHGKKPTDIWGNLPEFEIPTLVRWETASRGQRRGTQGITDSAYRALIPFALSMTLGSAIEREINRDYNKGE